MEAGSLTELDVAESLLTSVVISKVLRSTRLRRNRSGERLYVIQSTNLSGLLIYTKGKLVPEAESETYYFLISSKKAL